MEGRTWFGLTLRGLGEATAFSEHLRARGLEVRCYANGEVVAKLPPEELCLAYLEFFTSEEAGR